MNLMKVSIIKVSWPQAKWLAHCESLLVFKIEIHLLVGRCFIRRNGSLARGHESLGGLAARFNRMVHRVPVLLPKSDLETLDIVDLDRVSLTNEP